MSQAGDNTYATILPRNVSQSISNSNTVRDVGAPSIEVADYATLRNNSRAPSTVS